MKRNPLYQYIHFHSSEYVYIFYKIDDGLFVRILKDNHEFSNKKISDNVMDFAVEVDELGIFHLVCLALNGELVYWKNREFHWHHRILTKYDSSFYKFKGLKLFLCHQKIHILLAMANELNPELWTLKHHYWNNTVWHNKKICEMNCGKYDHPYQGDIDKNDHIHIVYKSRQNGKTQIYYSKFNILHNMWSTPQKMSTLSKENNHPFIFCDHENGLHLVWSCLENGSYEILYRHDQNSPTPKANWSEAAKLSLENSNCTHPLILECDDELKILWKQNNDYYIGRLSPNERSVDEAMLLSMPGGERLFLISVIGHTYKLYPYVKLILGYGVADDKGMYILGLDDIRNDKTSFDDQGPYHEGHSAFYTNHDDLTSHTTTRVSSGKFRSKGSVEDNSQIGNKNEAQTMGDSNINTSYSSEDIGNLSLTPQDLIIKIGVIEGKIEKVYDQLTYLTEKMEVIAPALSTLSEQGIQLQEYMATIRNEKNGLFRWLK